MTCLVSRITEMHVTMYVTVQKEDNTTQPLQSDLDLKASGCLPDCLACFTYKNGNIFINDIKKDRSGFLNMVEAQHAYKEIKAYVVSQISAQLCPGSVRLLNQECKVMFFTNKDSIRHISGDPRLHHAA